MEKEDSVPIAALVQAYPVFNSLPPVEVPSKYFEKNGSCAISPELWGIMEYSQSFTIRQHVKLLPKHCFRCPPCVEQENTYSIYAGLTKDSEAEILRADEVSDDCNRCCCSPHHPLRLEVRQYIPIPGDGSKSDYQHLSNDIRSDFSGFNGRRKGEALKELYQQQPVLLSMVRDDGMRCCKCPCKCLDTFVCFSCCQDGFHVYAGGVEDGDKNEVGRPFNLDTKSFIGSAIQPIYGGWCTPTIELRTTKDDKADPFAKITGPCFFGGWSEMCFEFKFFTTFYNSTNKGDVALITKKKPASFAGAAMELFSNSDVYTIQYNQNIKLSTEQKTTVLAAQLLADYMYFDGTTEKCEDDKCYLCYCSCIGAICPCYIKLSSGSA